MLNKENTKKAEEIAEQLRPLFARAYELGKKYDKARAQAYKRGEIANAWQYRTRPGCQAVGLDPEQLEKIRQENPRRWHEELQKAYKNKYEAEDRERVAFINFKNYLDYFARFLGDMIRPIWRELADRQGLHTLAEIINQKNPRKDHSAGACSVGIYDRGGELNPDKTKEGQYLRIETAIYTGWACGISGGLSRYYQINPAEVWHYAEEPQEMTTKQYKKNMQRIAQDVAKIEKMRDNLQEFAKGCGLYGFVEIVKNIEKGK